jgi:S1-C subfamily serine protease
MIRLTLIFLSIIITGITYSQKFTIKSSSPNTKVYYEDILIGQGENVETQLELPEQFKTYTLKNKGYHDLQIIIFYEALIKNQKGELETEEFGFYKKLEPKENAFYSIKPLFISYEKSFIFEKEIHLLGNNKFAYNRKLELKHTDKTETVLTTMQDESFEAKFQNQINETISKINKNSTDTVTQIDPFNLKLFSFKEIQYIRGSDLSLSYSFIFIKQTDNIKRKIEINTKQYSGDIVKLRKLAFDNIIEILVDKLLGSFEILELMKEPTILEIINLASPDTIATDLASCVKSCVTIEDQRERGHGSGFFIDNNGHIITNHHVIDNYDSLFNVTLNDGTKFEARLLRSDEESDLALLKIEHKNTFCIKVDTLFKSLLGDEVYAIGTPTSLDLTQTLSKGIISSFRVKKGIDMIQTDASVSFGNSGGPIVTKNGDLVGVVNSKFIGRGIEGIAFAIATNNIVRTMFIQYSK